MELVKTVQTTKKATVLVVGVVDQRSVVPATSCLLMVHAKSVEAHRLCQVMGKNVKVLLRLVIRTPDYNRMINAELILVKLIKEFNSMEPVMIVHLIKKDSKMVSKRIP